MAQSSEESSEKELDRARPGSATIDDTCSARQKCLQTLVLSYVSQLLYGCEIELCRTPTCLSCQKRIHRARKIPFQPPTELTARALALMYATDTDPYSALCPNRKRVEPGNFLFVAGKQAGSYSRTTHHYGLDTNQPSPQQQWKLAPSSSLSRYLPDFWTSLRAQRANRLDHSSLSQNFCNSIAVMTFCLQNLPSTNQLCEGLQASSNRHSVFERESDVASDTGFSEVRSLMSDHRPNEVNSREEKANVGPQPYCTYETLAALKDVPVRQRQRPSYHCTAYRIFPYDSRFRTISGANTDQYLFRIFSSTDLLLRSFRETTWSEAGQSPFPHLDPISLERALRGWSTVNGSLIFDSLHEALDGVFSPPAELNGAHRAASVGQPSLSRSRGRYLNDLEAGHIIMICMHALSSHVPRVRGDIWLTMRVARANGFVLPGPIFDKTSSKGRKEQYLSIADALSYEPALRLAEKLVFAIATRRFYHERLIKRSKATRTPGVASFPLMQLICQHLFQVERCERRIRGELAGDRLDGSCTMTSILVEWFRGLFIKHWSHNYIIDRRTLTGATLELMHDIVRSAPECCNAEALLLFKSDDERPLVVKPTVPYVGYRLDASAALDSFLREEHQPHDRHLFSYKFLFCVKELVSFFRQAHYMQLNRTFQARRSAWRLYDRRLRPLGGLLSTSKTSHVEMQRAQSIALFLNIDRAHALADFFKQILEFDEDELRMPLKVRMNYQGVTEDGIDQGGVTTEFFRLAIQQVLNEDNGLFCYDLDTRLPWLRNPSLVPDQHYYILGLLLSLAVANGVTLPVSFPNAFYYLLMGEPLLHVNQISDRWPHQAKTLAEVLRWDMVDEDDDNIFDLDFTYTFEVYGDRVSVDLDSNRQISGKSPASRLVTIRNRTEYVIKTMNMMLVGASGSHIDALRKGFRTCVSQAALSFLTPQLLKGVMEGESTISISSLRAATRYTGYKDGSPVIQWFWEIAEAFNESMRRKLLEFVTANDRVPIGDYYRIKFHVERTTDVEKLPSSSTCVATLRLPEYADKNTLETKLRIAVENSRGFGYI